MSLRPNLTTFTSLGSRHVGNTGCCPTAGKGSKLTSTTKVMWVRHFSVQKQKGSALDWTALCPVTSNKYDYFILPGLTIK